MNLINMKIRRKKIKKKELNIIKNTPDDNEPNFPTGKFILLAVLIIIYLASILIFDLVRQQNEVGFLTATSLFIFISTIIFLPELKDYVQNPTEHQQQVEPDRVLTGFIIFSSLAAISIYSIFILIMKLILNLLSIHLGLFSGSKLFVFTVFLIFSYIILIMPVIFWLKWISIYKKKVTNYHRIYVIIVTMLVFITIGCFFLSEVFKPTTRVQIPLEGVLTLNCENKNNPILVGSKTECYFSDNDFKLISGTIYFHLENGNILQNNITKDLKIYFPKDLANVELDTVVYNNIKNETRILKGDTNLHILTFIEQKEEKSKFLSFFLGLLAIAFFTIPIAIKNILDIYEIKK